MSVTIRSPFKSAILTLLLATVFISYPRQNSAQRLFEHSQEEQEDIRPIKLNQKNFQKNLEKYAHELELTPRQVKKLNRIDRKYIRKEARLARRPSTKRKQLRALQKTKREQMIAVLTYEQQKKLQELSRKGFWDFLRARR